MATDRAARFVRLLSLLSVVIREPGLSPGRLAERVEISERTLRRDLVSLRGLGYEITYEDGYQLQESLDLEGGSAPQDLARIYERQLSLVRQELPEPLASQVVADVEALAPAALASLFAAAVQRRMIHDRDPHHPHSVDPGLNRNH